MVKVIGVGDCMVDKNLTTGMMYPGGQALNIAVNTKLCGAQSAFIGAFGDDYIADHMKKTMDEIGIDYSHSHFYHAPNAFARYKVIDNDRVFQRSPNGRYNPLQGAIRRMLAYEGFSQEDIAYIKGFDVMHTSNGAFIEEYLPELAGEGIKISYDFSLDHMKEGVVFIGGVCDNKLVFVAKASKKAVSMGVHCGNLIRSAASVCDGKGGGKPDLAQGGGKNCAALDDAIQTIKNNLGLGV